MPLLFIGSYLLRVSQVKELFCRSRTFYMCYPKLEVSCCLSSKGFFILGILGAVMVENIYQMGCYILHYVFALAYI